jgi:hypothetical protein
MCVCLQAEFGSGAVGQSFCFGLEASSHRVAASPLSLGPGHGFEPLLHLFEQGG